MSKDELQSTLMDLITAAVDLGNSVQDDIKEQRSISDETILLLNDFRLKHDSISNMLDLINGIQ